MTYHRNRQAGNEYVPQGSLRNLARGVDTPLSVRGKWLFYGFLTGLFVVSIVLIVLSK